MDRMEFLQIIFCCVVPGMRRRKRRSTHVSTPVRPTRRVRTLGRGPDRQRRICWIRSRANYTDMRDYILGAISYDDSRTLVVWCPHNMVSTDYVRTALYRYGDIAVYRDNWTGGSPRNRRGVRNWAGSVVEYATHEEASLALRQLPMECRHIRILPLSHLLSLIIDCELLLGGFGRYPARVTICGRKSPNGDVLFTLRMELWTYGEVEQLLINTRESPGVVCEVAYPFLTQAYLAMMMIEGRSYGRVRLSATIEENERNDEIMEEARRSVMLATEAIFPY